MIQEGRPASVGAARPDRPITYHPGLEESARAPMKDGAGASQSLGDWCASGHGTRDPGLAGHGSRSVPEGISGGSRGPGFRWVRLTGTRCWVVCSVCQ